MTAEDPTTLGELRILLDGLTQRMEEAQKTALRTAAETAKAFENLQDRYITREYFDSKMETYTNRIARVETDVKELSQKSEDARHVIRQDMKDESIAIRKLVEDRVNAVQANLTELEHEQKAQDEALKEQKNVRIQAIIYAVVGAVLGIIGSIISTGIIKGLFPA